MVFALASTPDASQHQPITLVQWSNVGIPFAVLLCAAMLVPESSLELVHGRVIYSIWVALAFLVPALGLFFAPSSSPAVRNFWLLTWTASLLAYLVHFYFTVGVVFHGSLAEVYRAQGPVIATSNLLDTAWWMLDVILAWATASNARWIVIQRVGVHMYLPLTFFVSAVVMKHGFVRGLGIVMTVTLVASLLARWRARRLEAAVAPARLF